MANDDLSHSAAEVAVIRVRELMQKNGIRERQFSNKLADILELSYSQAHRKINSVSEWTIGDLESVAKYFRQTLSAIILGSEATNADCVPIDSPKASDASFIVGTHALACTAVIGAVLHTLKNTRYVAIKVEAGWHIMLTEDLLDLDRESVVKYRVESIHLSVKRPHKLSVAILDDDPIVASNLSDYLNETGFAATAFFDAESVQQAIECQKFDCFVLDWRLGKGTAETLIQSIRHATPLVPIFLLTGVLTNGIGGVSESEVARVIRNFDVTFQEKPIRLPILAAEISKELGVS